MKTMHTFASSLLLALAAGAAAVPARAQNGNVYVPLASNIQIGGANYTTKVWVSNPDGATHHITTTFIQAGTDGTTGAAPTSDNQFMAATASLVLSSVAPAGQTGLLSINGPGVLLVGARLEVTNADGTLLGIASVPVITQNDAAAAGSFIEVQGLERGVDNVVSDYALVNLGGDAAQCTVGAIDASGDVLAAPTTLNLPALSRRDFTDVLAILGQSSVSDVRVAATCNQPFYAFATLYAPGAGPIAFVAPSATLTGTVGPTLAGTGGGTPPGQVTFSVPGTFLNATSADSEQGYNLPVPVGTAYGKATITWTMHIGTFPTGLFTGVMAFRRSASQRSLREPFCAIQIVNRNSKTLLDLGLETAFERTVGPWKENGTYYCQMVYDLTADTCTLNVAEGTSGPFTYSISGPSQWFDMSATAAYPLNVDFGQTGIGDGAYYPPIGWTFSDLSVVMEPKQ